MYFDACELLLKYEWKISNFDTFLKLFVIFEKFEFWRTLHFGIFSTRTANAKKFIFVFVSDHREAGLSIENQQPEWTENKGIHSGQNNKAY